MTRQELRNQIQIANDYVIDLLDRDDINKDEAHRALNSLARQIEKARVTFFENTTKNGTDNTDRAKVVDNMYSCFLTSIDSLLDYLDDMDA